MKLTVFQSDKGDCLLLTTKDNKRMLVDGGMAGSYAEHVSSSLGALQKSKKALDVVYLSHIDEDHITGILQLMDDMVDWRVHDFQVDSGNAQHSPPDSHRPPEVKAIWHNAFSEQVGKNAGAITSMLASSAAVLSGHASVAFRRAAELYGDLATSTLQAIQLTRRVGAKQLGIPLNQPAAGKLMMVRPSKQPVKLGAANLSIIGPFEADLQKLRDEWNTWLDDHDKALEKVRKQAKADEDRFTSGDVGKLLTPLGSEAEILAAEVFGKRTKVTVPNLASLMFLVEEAGKSVLLTGDGHWQDILNGLDHYGKRTANGGKGIHVNVLKGQHHGSEHNWHADFTRAVTADDYIFCGNGAHENPDLGVVEMVIDSRLGSATQKSKNPEVGQPFTLWFNSSSDVKGGTSDATHMKAVEKLVAKRAATSGGKLKSKFLKASSFGVTV